MSVSGMAETMLEMSFELERRAKRLEAKWREQASHIQELTTESGKSHAEVSELKNRMETMEAQVAKMKQQLLLKNGKLVDNAEDEGQCVRKDDSAKKNPIDIFPKKVRSLEVVQNDDNGKDPTAIFPVEVWELIFEQVKEPQDLKSCYQTCTKFMWILQEKRSTFLFLDVLKVLQNQDNGMNLMDREPLLRRNFSEITKCRRVCYGWKQSVDQYLQENCPINEPRSRYELYSAPTAIKFTTSSGNPWTQYRALRNLSGDKNPMVSRFVALVYRWSRDPDNVKRQQKALRHFLQKFGHHVWHFKVCSKPDNVPFASWYASLLRLLRLMPNLKALHFYQFATGWGNGVGDSVAKNPFPTFPSLRSVALDCYPAEIMRSILTANPQIERLQFCDSKLTPIDLNSLDLNKIKKLTLDSKSFSFKKLNANWNLSKLTVGAPAEWKWSKVFRGLEHYGGGTLRELNLQMYGPCRETGLRLNLPNLRDLKMELTQCFASIDFILPLVNLECLRVDLGIMYPFDPECDVDSTNSYDREGETYVCPYVPIAKIRETVQFHGFIQDLRKSNIWRLFPKLKKVAARSDHFGERYGWWMGSCDSDDDEEEERAPLYDSKWKYCSRNQVDI